MSWKKVDDATLKLLRDQKAFEDETAKKLTPLYNSLKNPLVRLFIRRIVLDTMKHSDAYQTLIELNTRVVVGDIDRTTMTRELTTHVSEENKMLKRAIELSAAIKDEKYKQILEQIIEDERNHHDLLQKLLAMLKEEGENWNRYLYDMFTGAGIP